MLNIVMLAKDRPRLTEQALASLKANTSGEYSLTVVDDGSQAETQAVLTDFHEALVIRNDVSTGPGIARNTGIAASEKCFKRGQLLYLCDNDCYFKPGWDTTLLQMWKLAQPGGFRVLGGYCHPYQQPISRFWPTTHHCIDEVQALGLLSWLMAWETWDTYGPFAPTTTINGSEDWCMSQDVRRAGWRVGTVSPSLIVNCGLTGSNGKASPGAETLFRQQIPEGVIVE